MKKVKQTQLGNKNGNCLQACLATLLEIDIEKIPYFQDHKEWFLKMNNWLDENFNLVLVEITGLEPLQGYHIIGGQSPRGGYQHVCAGNNGEIVFDPHPDNSKLKKIEYYWYFLSTNPKQTKVGKHG